MLSDWTQRCTLQRYQSEGMKILNISVPRVGIKLITFPFKIAYLCPSRFLLSTSIYKKTLNCVLYKTLILNNYVKLWSYIISGSLLYLYLYLSTIRKWWFFFIRHLPRSDLMLKSSVPDVPNNFRDIACWVTTFVAFTVKTSSKKKYHNRKS